MKIVYEMGGVIDDARVPVAKKAENFDNAIYWLRFMPRYSLGDKS